MALRLMLEPLDIWLFRDGRPFTAGSDALARSRFPPSPYTVYGMLRSLLLFQAASRGVVTDLRFGAAVDHAVGAPDDFTRLSLRGPLLARWHGQRVIRYFPAPRDLVWAGTDHQAQPLLPAAAPLDGMVSSGLRPLWVQQAEAPAGLGDAWLAEDAFHAYLAGAKTGEDSPSPLRGEPASALYLRELRPGVGLDRQRRTAAEHLLYAVEYIRPRPGVGLVVDVLAGLDTAPMLLGFGGEGRGARCTTLALEAETPPPEVHRRVSASGRVKLVLATPALFAQGWLPAWVDPATLETRAGQPPLRLVAAAVPRGELIGSFDLVAGKPRPARRAVPAGSVYFFEEREPGAAAAALARWYGQCLSDEHAAIGFGLSYAGVWDPLALPPQGQA
ncbi:MAG TPA: type III-B CRISPR module-associated protein Cmr3 [Chloroflexota bacterium]|nr:type III-B CRISPR module-associated protein Cmr3 [Chloroflexota bacterium]